MTRLQILGLPEGSGDERPPFVLVVDQYDPPLGAGSADAVDRWRAQWQDVAGRIGARCVIATTETIEIPANEVPLDPDGYPVRLRVEADLTRFREQVDEALADVQRRTTTLRERAEWAEAERVAADDMLRAVCEVFGGPHVDPVLKARETLARAEAAEEKLAALGKQDIERMVQVTDALGLDRLRDWDEIVEALERRYRLGGMEERRRG
ncbi:hypothetical protein [Streptomyces misionensis]|uniref:hypothetical protein n=1 Tax=Streptomyces misionensis TaxID=67331 RepID=UPI00368F7219